PTDVAVLKINAEDLPAVTLGDSDQVEVGDVVLAIGNPFGVGETVTRGIVSATGRSGMGIEDYEDFIQTDAGINPAIMSRSGGSQGVGFAIPSANARHVMIDLVASGHVTRGYLGVDIQNV